MLNPMYAALGLNAPLSPSPFAPPSVGQGMGMPQPFAPPRPGIIPGSNRFFKNQFGPGTRVTLPGGYSSGKQAIRKAPPGTIVGL